MLGKHKHSPNKSSIICQLVVNVSTPATEMAADSFVELAAAPLVGNCCVDSGNHVHVLVLPSAYKRTILSGLSTRTWIIRCVESGTCGLAGAEFSRMQHQRHNLTPTPCVTIAGYRTVTTWHDHHQRKFDP